MPSMADWSTTAASNATVLGINIGENCPAANINNAIREIMAELRSSVSTNALAVSGASDFTTVNVSTQLNIGDTSNALYKDGSGWPVWQWDVGGNYTRFERGSNVLRWKIGNSDALIHRGASGALDLYASVLRLNGYTVMNTNNGGSGSLFDADKLDGQEGSYYSNITARLGYTPLDKAGDTIVSLTVSGQLNVGDANNAFYISSGNPVWQFDGGGDFISYDRTLNLVKVQIGGADAMLMRGSSGALDLYGTGIYRNGNLVWDAGNDGAGSGLDADTVDGYQASAFARITSSSIVQNGGYRVWSDGLIETWGYVTISPDSTGTFNLPVPHTSWVVPVISAYWPSDQTVSQHAVDWASTNGTPPTSISFRNSDDRTVTVWVQTKGA